MIRWWDDAAAAELILAGVDDRDVVQGVGTAVLGYHAIAKAALTPLLSETLVDPARVWEALGSLDLSPVAKALGAATEPVLGPASGHYGEILAADIHSQAQAGLETLMAQLGATGIPMPWVVERAVEVVGVPPRHLGGYSKVAKERVVPPAVRADAADRVLMEFAKRLGEREAYEEREDGSAPVAKTFGVEFDESEHPRDHDGRFAVKQDRPRRSRRERMASAQSAAANRRAVAAAAAPPAVEPARPSLAALARALAHPVATTRTQATRAQTTRAQETRRQETRGLAELKPVVAAPAAPAALPHVGYDPAAAPNRAVNQHAQVHGATRTVSFAPEYAATFLAPVGLSEVIANSGVWAPQADLEVSPNGTRGVWENRMMSPDPSVNFGGAGLAGYEIRGIVPVKDDDGQLTYTIPAGTRLRVVDQTSDVTQYPSPNPAMPGPVTVVTTFILEVANPEDYEDLDHIPLPGGEWRGGKAIEQWNVGGRPKLVSVERNEEGEFAEAGVAPVERESRRVRMARASAARSRSQARRAAAVAAATPATPLASITRTQATRAQATRSQTTRGQATRAESEAPATAVAAAPQAMFMSASQFGTIMGGDRHVLDYVDGAVDSVPHPQLLSRLGTVSASTLGTVDAVEAFAERAKAPNRRVLMTTNKVEHAQLVASSYEHEARKRGDDTVVYSIMPTGNPGELQVVAQRHLGNAVGVVGSPEAMAAWQTGQRVKLTTVPPVGGLGVIEEKYGLPPGAFGKTDGVVVVHVELPHDGSQR